MVKLNKTYIVISIAFATMSFMQKTAAAQNVFDKIYERGSWGCKGCSGHGSKYEVNKEYIAYLQNFIKTHHIKSIVDIGSGDWQIMRHVNLTGVNYIGFDVAQSVIDINKRKYGNNHIKFVKIPLKKNYQFPQADLMIVKDVLQHLPNSHVNSILQQLYKYKYAFIINDFTNHTKNRDIQAGGYRHIDVRKEPFYINNLILINTCCPWHSDGSKKFLLKLNQ